MTIPQLADHIDVVMQQVAAEDRLDGRGKVAATIALSFLLKSLGLKTETETMKTAIDRMRTLREAYDLLDSNHREQMAQMLHQMLFPLGIKKIILLGLSPEGKVFISHFQHESEEIMPTADIKKLLRAISDSADEDEISL